MNKDRSNSVIHLSSVDSTNKWLRDNAHLLEYGAVCYTDNQTHGRGRLQRGWQSLKGKSVSMSLLLQPPVNPTTLPLVCGIAVLRALKALTGGSFHIKWPNDIICDNLKICGILCENFSDKNNKAICIAGIGVNLLQTAQDFKNDGLPHGGSVYMVTDISLTPFQTAVAIAKELNSLCDKLTEQGFASLKDEYLANCVNINKQVRVISHNSKQALQGVVLGITDQGFLLVNDGQSTHAVMAGDVSVRGLNGYV